MRDIKFRVWDKQRQRFSKNNMMGMDGVICNTHLEHYVLMQYTGLLDNHGIEVYEEDFIKDKDYLFIIKWQSGGFVLSPVKYSKNTPYIGRQIVDLQNASYIRESCEVIGNVWENKELLKDKLWD